MLKSFSRMKFEPFLSGSVAAKSIRSLCKIASSGRRNILDLSGFSANNFDRLTEAGFTNIGFSDLKQNILKLEKKPNEKILNELVFGSGNALIRKKILKIYCGT